LTYDLAAHISEMRTDFSVFRERLGLQARFLYWLVKRKKLRRLATSSDVPGCKMLLRWSARMGEPEQMQAEKTYRAIGRFMFEFSQVEYSIRHRLAEEIGLNEEYFAAVVESYEVETLCSVGAEVFTIARTKDSACRIKHHLNHFRRLDEERKRIAHGLWVPSQEGESVHYVSHSGSKLKLSTNQVETLEQLADEIRALRSELEKAFVSIG
jgi:hypothetical protein